MLSETTTHEPSVCATDLPLWLLMADDGTPLATKLHSLLRWWCWRPCNKQGMLLLIMRVALPPPPFALCGICLFRVRPRASRQMSARIPPLTHMTGLHHACEMLVVAFDAIKPSSLGEQ